MIKLKTAITPKIFTPAEFPIGAIGIIRKWSVDRYIGLIVYRSDKSNIRLVDPTEQVKNGGWGEVSRLDDKKFQIEKLPKGAVIEITVE